nr:hypothetical protein GCM10020092_002530 [Actinoplanes digitatis]
MVRIVDPPNGDRTDEGEAAFTVDNDEDTVWRTSGFNQSKIYNKPGMGLLINLGTPRTVSDVRVETSQPGIAMDIRTGPSDPGNNSNGDDQIVKTYKKLGDGDTEKTKGTNVVFPVFDETQKYQYIMVFITDLPRDTDGKYRAEISKVEVYGN